MDMKTSKYSVLAGIALIGFIAAKVIGFLNFRYVLRGSSIYDTSLSISGPITIDQEVIKLGLSFVVSLVALFLAGKVALSKKTSTPAEDKKWAYGTIGTVLGYWIG
jgi:hypothetical protein